MGGSARCRYIAVMPLLVIALLVGYFGPHGSWVTHVAEAAQARRTHSPTLAAAFDSRLEI